MFAVLKTGGKQYRVVKDDVVTVEKLAGEAGDAIEFNEILMLGGDEPKLGTPLVAGATVKGEVLEQLLGPKVISFRKRRRKHSSQRKRGHRQHLTRVRITDISAGGAKAAKAEAELPAEVRAATPVEAAEPAPAI
jgi:large subunit ribosomal protein L21